MRNLSPLQAIRKNCLACFCGSSEGVSDCRSPKCLSFPYRLGKRPDVKPPLTPLETIRAHCLACVGDSPKDVTECKPTEVCYLHEYRFGTNPRRKGIGRKGGNPNLSRLQALSGTPENLTLSGTPFDGESAALKMKWPLRLSSKGNFEGVTAHFCAVEVQDA